MDETRARALLTAERESLETQLAQAQAELGEPERERAGELADVDQHPGDLGSELNDRQRAEGRREELLARMAELERAEDRLARGVYGISVDSGAPIPDERLEALPTAERTVEEEAALARTPERPDAGGDDTTPLDAVEPPPPDLASIPMRRGDDEIPDRGDEDLAESLDAPGEVYADGRSVPKVGEPEPEDADIAGRYRPR
jgi:RNA polymerase-binding transcription factor DksA